MKLLIVLLTAVLSFFPSVAGAVRLPPGPLWHEPPALRRVWSCILWHESRSTFARVNLSDNSRYGSSGIFQMTPVLWNRWAPLVGVRVPVWRATPAQQERVAYEVQTRDGGFWPWKGDGCV